jgi:hypothetical protein
MARILHLTDLHLEQPGDYGGADAKSGAVPASHLPSRTSAIRNTLQAVATSEKIVAFDAAVISGDIPWKNQQEGWEALANVLAPLEEAGKLPAPDHIVATPGNHDVEWRLAVDDTAHYDKFIQFVRDKGYITPLLDRREVEHDGSLVAADPSRHFLFDAELGLAIVPVNTSHYCGVHEPLKLLSEDGLDDILGKLEADEAQRLRDELLEQRLFDIPRVSDQQLQALDQLIRTHLTDAIQLSGRDERDILRVAVMHHHTLPVTLSEELKAFESLTNLGKVRQFLRDKRFRLLLHGHKHAAGIYWDRIHREGASLQDPDWNLLVVSGSTLGSQREGQEELARFLDIQSDRRNRSVTITRLPLIPVGGAIPEPLSEEQASIWGVEMRAPPTASIITGHDANEVYQRVQALFAPLAANEAVRNLVCEISSRERAEQLPDGYPDDVPGESLAERQAWFAEMVQWWQRKETRLLAHLHFTHGQRLHEYGENRVDQIKAAVQLLQNEPGSSRAVITLIDPNQDKPPDNRSRFPAFSLVHLAIRTTAAQVAHLDCFGFFRKQEMRFWWPINVAELQRIQEDVLKKLSRPDLRPGSIITYSAFAHVDTAVPDVNVTAIDRLADDGDRGIEVMAYFMAHPEEVDADAARADWRRVLDDLEPKDETAPRPVLGLRLLRERLDWLQGASAPGRVNDVHSLVVKLENDYAALGAGTGDPMHWIGEIRAALAALREAVESAPSRG